MGDSAKPKTERRQITVLFYDLVGSTKLSTSVEPEDFREAISNFHNVASAAVQPFDAYVGAHVGDGGIIYFGYPVASEDAAECAVLSGLALIDAVSKITLPNGEKAKARVGIATGTSIVGRIEEGDTGNSAVGQVTSLAARLQSYAKANQCVIAERTRRLVGGLFQLEDLGIIDAKGFAENVRAFGVIARSQQDRFRALRGGNIPLIGRKSQTHELHDKWAKAQDGTLQVCMVEGEAGVGKSRFVADFIHSLDHTNATFIPCFCAPHSRQAALRPFITRLRNMAGASDHQSQPSLETFDNRLAPGTSELDRHMLGALIGLDTPAPQEVAAMNAGQLRRSTISAILNQIDLLAQQAPVVVLMEDMHWADPTTFELLEGFLSQGDAGRIMVIMTARPDIHDIWQVSKSIARIELPPLTDEEAGALINQVLGAKASPSMVEAITERASGIALFIEELTKAILDSEAHVPGSAAEGLGVQSSFTLPETLQDSLLARLDQLGEAKRIAQIASVVGREFTIADLARVAPDLTPLIERGCKKLLEAGLTVAMPGKAEEFQFRHVLIQEIAYSTLVRGERREYNACLLEALEQNDGKDNPIDPERWAHYALEAGLPARAVHYWLLAGQDALRVFAMKEAEARLRRGHELIGQVGDPSERARLELDILLTLGKVLLAQVGHANPETGKVYARARELAEERGDRARLLASMHGQQSYDLQLSRIQETQDRGAEMLSMGETFDDDAWRLIGYRSRGIASFPLGDYKQCASDLLAGIAMLDQIGDSAAQDVVADDLLAAMQIYASWALVYMGETARGEDLYTAACARAEEISQPYTRAFAGVGRNYCRLMLGDFHGLEQDLEDCIALCAQNEIHYFLFTERVHLAHYRALNGASDGAQQIAQAIEEYRQTGSILYQPTYRHWEGLAWLGQGELGKAREANDWAIETTTQYGMTHMLAEYYGLKAVLDHLDQKPDEALAAATMARNWATDQEARLCEDLNKKIWEKFGFYSLLPA
ncbi:AAA family ATPase [Erythrobacter sp. SCSIO 43205]|uniref:ATP-binding protein n=1 Tax=Erythrobacter sp. SCSIO 43205 TaxID=2779361 RepID=UPI001CA7BC7F|nr:adenylate/guanylate cyclase domain-containing protein [Erythrobacter sp. SCSIO 43205]UAB79377.1 AAA family ATPase [Erythrobacter sp. SCSIO 43205]